MMGKLDLFSVPWSRGVMTAPFLYTRGVTVGWFYGSLYQSHLFDDVGRGRDSGPGNALAEDLLDGVNSRRVSGLNAPFLACCCRLDRRMPVYEGSMWTHAEYELVDRTHLRFPCPEDRY